MIAATALWTRAGFSFLKEWGGIGTLLIAVLYTFPLEIYDRLANSSTSQVEKLNASISKARQDLSQIADMTIKRAQDATSAADPALKLGIYAIYGLRIAQKLEENRDVFLAVASNLSSLEVRMIGEIYVMNGQYPEGIALLEKALESAGKETTSAGKMNLANTELAIANAKAAYFGAEKFEEIRSHYKRGIRSAWKVNERPNNILYYQLLTESSLGEMRMGDWDCGKRVAAFVLERLTANFTGNVEVSNYANLLRFNANSIARPPTSQKSNCLYEMN